jgi:hypothetical protein
MKDILRLHNLYIGVTKCAIGDGATCCLWIDPWSKNILEAKFPRIASYAKDTMIFVRGVLKVEELDELFFLPLSVQVAGELQNITFDEDEDDSWITIWRGDYSSKNFYSHIYDAIQAHPIYKAIWSLRCTPRIKFFAWLVCVD